MKLKRWTFRSSGQLLLLLFFINTYGQDSTRHRLWPHQYMLQYAGGIGTVAIGAGYINRKQWLEGDIFYGYIPQSAEGVTIHAFTGKFTASLIRIHKDNYQIKPLRTGVLVSYTPGKQYFGFSPENYPFDYYRFPTSLHAGAFVGGQFTKKQSHAKHRQFGFYYELITFDRELISYLNNRKSLAIADIINIGIGCKLVAR
jgi:hypothetical protein